MTINPHFPLLPHSHPSPLLCLHTLSLCAHLLLPAHSITHGVRHAVHPLLDLLPSIVHVRQGFLVLAVLRLEGELSDCKGANTEQAGCAEDCTGLHFEVAICVGWSQVVGDVVVRRLVMHVSGRA